jgi:hypothetical protein
VTHQADKRQEHTIQAIEKVVADYERSGLTRREFSQRSGIAIGTLDWWRRRVRKRQQSRLVPVRVTLEPDRPAIAGGGFHLTLPSGVMIESRWDFDEAGMARLLRLLEER